MLTASRTQPKNPQFSQKPKAKTQNSSGFSSKLQAVQQKLRYALLLLQLRSISVSAASESVTMSRPWVLVCLLLLIVFTSQFEWKQYGNDEPSPSTSKKQYISEREEAVKEKIILSQEKNIQKLNDLVRSLREQLLQCRGENEIVNGTSAPLTELLSELERHPLLED